MNKSFKYLKCHPKNNTRKSCLTNELLFSMRKKWNQRHPDQKINSRNPTIIEQKLKNYLSYCNDSSCLVNTLSNVDNKKLFAPKMPESWNNDPKIWLNSLDIMKVMKQYEEAYKEFDFFGPSPIDFDSNQKNSCVWPEICHFNINNQLKNKKYKNGFIFNLDKHYQEGSHWICMFLDLEKKFILCLDSNGNEMPNEIKTFVHKIKNQCEQKNISLKYYDNDGFRHQEKDGQCGMYCLYTIIELLKNKKSPSYFNRYKISDELMEKHRNIYFNQ